MDEKTTTSPTAPVPPPPSPNATGGAQAPSPGTAEGAPHSAPEGTPHPAGPSPGAAPHDRASGWSSLGSGTPTTVFGTPTPPPGHPQAPPGAPAPKRRRGGLLLAGLAIGAILGGGAGAAVTTILDDDSAPTATRSSLDATDDGSDSSDTSNVATTNDVQQVAEQVLPSVVSIAVQTQMGGTGGTGVIISSDGEILTNNHVVEAAAGEGGGTVEVTFQDGTTAEAEVVGTDLLTDLAVIKAKDVSDLVPAELGSSGDMAVGQEVVAIGSPLGLDGTVTSGIISAIERPVEAGEPGQAGASVIDALQTDAPINPGNSGGPLVNMNGQVIGINSVIMTAGQSSGSIGLGFSIPIDQAKPIAQELLETGKATHARIGIGVGNPQDGTRGALVASVEPNTSGAEAGLQEGDVITKIDDRVITDGTSLIAAARSHRPGDTVTLTYLRGGEEQIAELTLGSDAQTT